MTKPSFLEDHTSQVPALQLLQNMGFAYLRPQDAFMERKGKLGNVLLEGILAEQLRRLNRIQFRGNQFEFTAAAILAAIQALKEVPFDGLVRTSEKIYDLLVLGKAMEQTLEGETKSFTLNFVDWRNPANNVFHVVEEFEVERTASKERCRPDLVLFVNGIPLCVIECKRSDMKDPLDQAISQQIRNQGDEYIPKLFCFTQLLVALAVSDSAYATTGTPKGFWAKWRELEDSQTRDISKEVAALINRPLIKVQKDALFADRFGYVRAYFEDLEAEGREVTDQDRTLYCICLPERLLELAWKFIIYDAGEKKIARYQQYFTVNSILARVRPIGKDGRRLGGVVWHTQGSGKSLTMVMLAQALARERDIPNPVIVLVTDRVDLDEQIKKTFLHCGLEPVQAQTGKHLTRLITEGKVTVITTVIDKFASAVESGEFQNDSPNLFVLVDESHRSVYGETGAKMEKVLPKACFIGFTGTPLMKKEHKTANKFGGYINPSYTIDQAVRDKAVVPLLYEGRLVLLEVDQKAIDKWFEVVTQPLSDAQRADMKRKFASADQLNKAERRVFETAFDISEHFRQNWQGTGFKAQLAAPNKATALKYKKYLDEFGKVTSEVVISAPDTREEQEDILEVDTEEVRAFWKKMMARYGSEKEYLEQVINAFKHGPDLEILIVVSKLMTGFDAPKNTILYLCRSFQEHNLLQAIARVNRLAEGKDFGFIIDYYGVLQKLGQAMDIYSALPGFERDELAGTAIDVADEIKKLPQKHSELWDVFKTVRGSRDKEKFEVLLADEERRAVFYEKLNAYHRTLSVALSAMQFLRETPAEKIQGYKDDLAFFLKLRVSVKQRYAEEVDFKEYEKKVQKLIDAHVRADGIQQITSPVNIFEREAFKSEVEKLESVASKADTIAHRTARTITEKMDEDPVFYRRFGRLLQDVIDDYRAQRITDADYLKKATEVHDAVVTRTGDKLPEILKDRDVAKAFYGVVNEIYGGLEMKEDPLPYNAPNEAAGMAVRIDDAIQARLRVDWRANADVQNDMRNAIDDLLYEARAKKGLPLTAQDMDAIIERALEIAKNRYPR